MVAVDILLSQSRWKFDFGFFVSYICIVQSVQNKQKTRHNNGNQHEPHSIDH